MRTDPCFQGALVSLCAFHFGGQALTFFRVLANCSFFLPREPGDGLSRIGKSLLVLLSPLLMLLQARGTAGLELLTAMKQGQGGMLRSLGNMGRCVAAQEKALAQCQRAKVHARKIVGLRVGLVPLHQRLLSRLFALVGQLEPAQAAMCWLSETLLACWAALRTASGQSTGETVAKGGNLIRALFPGFELRKLLFHAAHELFRNHVRLEREQVHERDANAPRPSPNLRLHTRVEWQGRAAREKQRRPGVRAP